MGSCLALLSTKLIWRWNFSKKKSIISYWIEKCGDKKTWTVVQIGANDGKTKDLLYTSILRNDKWKVLFVEPVPYLFEKLKTHYPDSPRFFFENAAINNGTRQDFYWVDKKAKYILGNLPEWYDQLGSFDKSHISKHLNGILDPFIVSKSIQGITLETLFQKHGIRQIDLLRIDCEGHDWKILSQLNLSKFKPSLILLEIKHLNREELNATRLFLINNYRVYQFEGDFVCFSNAAHDQLSKKDIKYLLDFHSIHTLKTSIGT
ncbi:FkbM family methyltransferase [Lunatimonas salinarum]|uniref:FkbM family methyltransferase n=1 Tax=Lunatimonas salinarum TaxID=1774590 RepID=UPI001AE05AFA|nr:FkbM family methyltransferase [Lunatimonas salinarum]